MIQFVDPIYEDWVSTGFSVRAGLFGYLDLERGSHTPGARKVRPVVNVNKTLLFMRLNSQ